MNEGPLTQRIAGIIEGHHQADEWGYPVEECHCGEWFAGTWAEHLAVMLTTGLELVEESDVWAGIDAAQ